MGQLIDALSTAVPAEQMDHLARLLGDTPEATRNAMAAAVPALLGTLANRATHGGMDEVMALVGPLLEGGDPLDRFTAALTDSNVRGHLMAEGHALTDGLLGPATGALAAAVSTLTGTRAHTVAEVMKLAGPVGVGVVARQLGGVVTADRLEAALEAERPALLAALPQPLAPLVAASAAEPVPLHGTPVEGAAGSARDAARWLPWLAAAVLAIIVVASFQAFERESAETASAPATTPIITETEVKLAEVRLPDGSVLMLPQGSAALELARALSGGAGPRSFRLDGSGDEAVHAVASVLKAWPAAKVRIEGHGDGTGDPAASLAESRTRAQGVADMLAADGVAADSITAAGLGGAQPIATTDTAEGRAQNRRTLIILTSP